MTDLNKEETPTEEINEPSPGKIGLLLTNEGIKIEILAPDHLGIEMIGIKPNHLFSAAKLLKNNGFNYLQCQGGYDEGPGLNIVCFYHLIQIKEYEKSSTPIEVRLKVFLPRDGDLSVPSLYTLYKGSDWQERETYDMYGVNFTGHPHPKRLLMPEDWKGWPLRKDYVQPDFYEMQDAY